MHISDTHLCVTGSPGGDSDCENCCREAVLRDAAVTVFFPLVFEAFTLYHSPEILVE